MIVTLSYRGVFRQEQYETITVEGSLTLDSSADSEWFAGLGDDLYACMRRELFRIVGPVIRDAETASRYSADETVIYEWERIIDEAGDQAPRRQQGRRIQRRG